MPSASEIARQDEERTASVGHNSVAVGELRGLIERVERLAEERKAIGDDIRDVFGEAKARGYDVKTMRKVIAYRKLQREVFQESRALEDAYLAALGLL